MLPVFFLMSHSQVENLSGERSSLSSRVMIWRTGLYSLADHPLWGIGLGNFQKIYLEHQPYFSPYLEWAVPQPHNFVLALWLQAGLLGLTLLGYIVWISIQASKQSKLLSERRLLVALLIGTMAYGIFDTPLFGNALALVWWGNLIALFFSSEPEQKEI
jgi:O-antigen ligase